MNFQMFKLDLEKAKEPEIKLPTFSGSSKKQESFRKNIYFCFIDYAKAFDSVDHNKVSKIFKEMGTADHLICLLRNLHAAQEVSVRSGHGTMNRFKTGKGVSQDCIVHGVTESRTRLSDFHFHFTCLLINLYTD